MALEQLSPLGPADGEAAGHQLSADGSDWNKVVRLPRWTRQEILVHIRGKTMAKNRLNRGHASRLIADSNPHCLVLLHKAWKVDRGPVQCRKRWSNLMGDFKKINEWESFWLMRNALRRDEKLPGVFYREVFDILDDGGGGKEEVLGRERRRRLSLIRAGAPRLVMDYSLILSSRVTRSPVFVGVPPSGTINHLVKSLLVKVRIMREKMSQKLKFKAHRKEGKKQDAIDGGRETADLQHQLLEAVERKGKF